MSRTLMAVFALSAAAACAAAATTTTAQGPSQSQIVDAASDRLADASATMAAPPSVNAANAPAVETAQYIAPDVAPAPIAVAASAAMTCEIRATRTADGVRLEAFAHTSGPIVGTYDIAVTKSGASGSSDISQGGEFDTASAPTAALGASELSLERGDRLHARLSVHASNGTSCHDDLRS